MILKSMYIYPVKSLGGIEIQESKMQIQGLEYDRRWMILDEHGRFMTQRNDVTMALIKTKIADNSLIFSRTGFSQISIPLSEPKDKEFQKVKIWKDQTEAIQVPGEINEWLTDVLKRKCSIVQIPADAVRRRTTPEGPEERCVSFADSQPVLIVNETSLAELNSRLEQPVPMSRFRANFVVEAPAAWEEDKWTNFSIGSAEFEITKACGRCQVVTIDQETGEKSAEPFKTLSSYRFFDKNVNFGMRAKWINQNQKNTLIKVGANFKCR